MDNRAVNEMKRRFSVIREHSTSDDSVAAAILVLASVIHEHETDLEGVEKELGKMASAYESVAEAVNANM